MIANKSYNYSRTGSGVLIIYIFHFVPKIEVYCDGNLPSTPLSVPDVNEAIILIKMHRLIPTFFAQTVISALWCIYFIFESKNG